jgi:hypothetical protein
LRVVCALFNNDFGSQITGNGWIINELVRIRKEAVVV